MELYAISDLHLGPGSDKAHYSSKWKNHQSLIRKNWDTRIPDDSVVFMPGDFSWHQVSEDLFYDYFWIHHRKGALKILSPGNHDYGVWKDQSGVSEFCKDFDTLLPLMGNAARIENPYNSEAPGIVVCGSRGTQSPADKYFNSNSGASARTQEKEAVLYVRELARLALTLQKAKQMQKENDALVVMIHYPPFADGNFVTQFSKMISEAGADLCLYGHLHQETQWASTFQGKFEGVEYRFVGTDFLEFEATHIGTWDKQGVHIMDIEREARVEWTTEEVKVYSSTTSYGTGYSSGNYTNGYGSSWD